MRPKPAFFLFNPSLAARQGDKNITNSEEDKLMDMVQTQCIWRPHHHGATPNDYKTFYIVIDGEELDTYVKNNCNTIELATWKKPAQTLCWESTDSIGLHVCCGHFCNGSHHRSGSLHQGTTSNWVEIYSRRAIGRGLMAYYAREGSDYKESENHSDQMLQLHTWTHRCQLVIGCNYGYLTELLNTMFYKQLMIDVAAVNGPGHAYMSNLRHLRRDDKSQGCAINKIKEAHPDYN